MKIEGSGLGGMDPRIRIHTKMSWIRNTECNRQVFKYSEKFNHFAKRRMEAVCGRSFEDGGVAALPQLFQLHIRL
jgi:hypothetical protein